MLTWSIKSNRTKPPNVKVKYRAGSAEHKQSILDHTLKNNGFNIGEYVLTDDYETGVIWDIQSNQAECDWLGLKPMPIGVWVENYNCTMYYHPNSLSITGK